jgi:ribosome maturation factor RimP
MAQRGAGAAAGARSQPSQRASAWARQAGPDGTATRDREGSPRSAGDLSALRARLQSVIEPCLAAYEVDLEDLAVTRAGRRYVVRVTVDGDDGVDHDQLGDLSREISAALDAADGEGAGLLMESYTLEVSSPGVDRPLTQPRHWRRNRGRLVKVKAGDRMLTARVVTVDDSGVTLDTGSGLTLVDFAQLGAGHVQIEFNRLAELTDADFGPEIDDDEIDDESDDEVDDIDGDDAQRRTGQEGGA